MIIRKFYYFSCKFLYIPEQPVLPIADEIYAWANLNAIDHVRSQYIISKIFDIP